ncbi:MAG: carbon-nitrogen hydrolase family protein [Anaerolineae bacterium]|nr:carbon-nitrogen hydrolase family protein [Anaerolineae bacterium]
MREITVATVQMKPELGELENNLVKMSDIVSKIANQQKVDLILFPELVTSGYELGVKFTNLAQLVPGPTVNLMAQRAQQLGVHIAFGMVAKERVESILYDAAVLIGPDGEFIGDYRKAHLKGEERMAFREGYRLPVFETQIGNIGMVLGWDLAFPEVARSLVLDGAELLCVLASWEKDDIEEWKTYLKARAYENAVFVAGSNRVGEDVTLTFGGESMIVGPRGKVHASLSNNTSGEAKKDDDKKDEGQKDEKAAPKEKKGKFVEGYCVARIDLDEVKRHREERLTLQARQPTVYRNIVRKY